MQESSTSLQIPMANYTMLFEAMAGNDVLLQADAPIFTIIAATPSYIEQSNSSRDAMFGKGIFEVFPDSDDPGNTGTKELLASLLKVIESKQPHQLPVQRYDTIGEDGQFIERYWRATNKPVFAPGGEVAYILHSVAEITDQINAEKREVQLDGIEKVHELFMNATIVVGLVNGDDYVLEMANKEAFKLWGKGEEIIGKPILEALPELNGQGIIELFDQVRSTGEPFIAHEVPVTSFAGGKEEQHYFNLVYQPYYSKNATKATGVFTISHDVTEQVKSRQIVQRSEEALKRFKFMADNAQDPFILMRQDGTFAYLNKKALDAWDYTDEEAKNIRVPDVDPVYKDEGFAKLFEQAQAEAISQFETIHKRKDGFVYPVEVKVNGLTIGGEPYMFSIARNITERRRSEEALRESEAKYRTLYESMDQGYCTIELIFDDNRCIDFRYLETNPAFERQSGLHNAIGKTITELAPNIEPKWFQIYGNVALTGNPIRVEEESKALNRWFEVYAMRVGGAEERKVGVFFTDITSRKSSELLLQENEALLRTVFDASPNSLSVFEPVVNDEGEIEDLKFLIVNHFTVETTGTADLVGKRYAEEFPHVRQAGILEAFLEVAKTGVPADFEKWYKGEGLQHWFRFIVNKVGNLVVATVEDITKRKEAEKAMQESETRFRSLADESPMFVFIIDADPTAPVNYWNKTWLQYTGQTLDKATGQAWASYLHADDLPFVMEHYTDAFQARTPYFIPAVRIKRHDGVYRWHAFKGHPRFDANGEFNGYIGVGFDVHEQKLAKENLEELVAQRTEELQRVNTELLRSNANLEEFAHAASHDLKEPVRKIHFFTNQLKQQLGSHFQEKEERAFNRIENATERMASLIDDLLLYSHVSQRPHEKETVDLNLKVQRVLEDLELDIEEKAAIIEIDTLPVVKGYPRQLQQVFQNLLSNALKYSSPGVVPQINVVAGQVTEMGKAYYSIAVRDNGIGFSPEYSDVIFKMFTRLHGKSEYSGTGVGLSIVKKVVENHDGMIRVETAPGAGSTFHVLLPV
ncbi:PAS domain S-box protein [Aridibaculum aurantiacum]|uniref:PAS domain S-box protein n=1 Tax=Aridibaculum aurantiacum TaxID=2810307 RepID=UPI001A96E406|nr:PAS domain S-box protein [Aridibaculum aurantiacum]